MPDSAAKLFPLLMSGAGPDFVSPKQLCERGTKAVIPYVFTRGSMPGFASRRRK